MTVDKSLFPLSYCQNVLTEKDPLPASWTCFLPLVALLDRCVHGVDTCKLGVHAEMATERFFVDIASDENSVPRPPEINRGHPV